MTSSNPSPLRRDQIDPVMEGTTRNPNLPAATRKAAIVRGPSKGHVSGIPEFDRLLEKLHAAFAELARTDINESNAIAAATDDLSLTYTTLTGRNQPQEDSAADALANRLKSGLTSLASPLTGSFGQNMLRAL